MGGALKSRLSSLFQREEPYAPRRRLSPPFQRGGGGDSYGSSIAHSLKNHFQHAFCLNQSLPVVEAQDTDALGMQPGVPLSVL